MGDIHGDLPALTAILRRAALVDLKGNWIGDDTVLVSTGDLVDRGRDLIAITRFFDQLRPQAEKAGGAVVNLLGNHELSELMQPADPRALFCRHNSSYGSLTVVGLQ